VAEEEAGRQRAPELGNGIAAPDAAPITDSTSASAPAEPPVDAPAVIEKPSWREPDAPALPALLNRKRTTEKRDQDKTIRFTPTAVRIIAEEAERRGQKFAASSAMPPSPSPWARRAWSAARRTIPIALSSRPSRRTPLR
jgi:hypothetical protein